MKIIQTKTYQIAVNEYGDSCSKRVCLMLPGRLDTKDYSNFVSHGEFLASLDIFAVAIDPPGTWESPGSIDDYSTSMYIQAVNELIEYYGNKETVLFGHSRGGAAAMLASSNPAVTSVVLINAAYGAPSSPNVNKIMGGCLKESRDLPPGNVRTKEQRTFLLPLGYFEDGKKYDPAYALKKFSGNKLLIHATKDEFCGVDEVKTIFDQLSMPKTMEIIDCTHDYRLFPQSIAQVNQALKKLIKDTYL